MTDVNNEVVPDYSNKIPISQRFSLPKNKNRQMIVELVAEHVTVASNGEFVYMAKSKFQEFKSKSQKAVPR